MSENKVNLDEKELARQQAQVEVNELVEKAQVALQSFLELDQEQVDHIVAKCSVAALDAHGRLARLAVEETKRGVFEDKATKNLFASEYIVNNMRGQKTVGIIGTDPLHDLEYVADPVGVVCGITPVTNPTSTVIFKSLICLKTRNPIVFAFHPLAQQCSKAAAQVMYEAAIKAGAPKDCIQWVEHPSMDSTNLLMNHDGVATILATGGNAMVKAAYSCGKPALGVGAGNVPAYVEKSANLRQAANDIASSKAFDNGMICASEQTIIIDDVAYDKFLTLLKDYHVHICNKKEKELLEKYAFGVKAYSKDVDNARLNSAIAGKDATWIAQQAGFEVDPKTIVLACEVKEIGPNEPMTREKLSPTLALIRCKDSEEGVAMALQCVEFNGLGHSAAIHTADTHLMEEFGKKLKACRILVNQPSTFGGIGNIYNELIPSLTLGCGSYGHNSVSGNVSTVNLINVKTIGRRRNSMQWFKVPPKIYFERNSINYLKDIRYIHRAFIVCDHTMVDLGFTKRIMDVLAARPDKVDVQLYCDVEPDPSIQTVRDGVKLMNSFQPDVIIALGGGSAMDAAKGMWLFYEQPDVSFDDIKQKFMDIRKRAFQVPELGKKARLVCVPTTSGTGSEVTPFAVISDKVENKKYPLTDYALTPNVAIIDSAFTENLPKSVTADTGIDVLTHAAEAFVSTYSNDYTDGLCVQAVKLVFNYLPRAYEKGANDRLAREKMANAAAIGGMCFANGFLGVCHSMAHKIGARYHVPHGRANAILLPHVIRYNGTHPSKPGVWPKANEYVADKKYAELANDLGMPFTDVEQGVILFADACYDLIDQVGIQQSFQAQGIDEKTWFDNLEDLVYEAYEDQCTPANPRVCMLEEMKQILTDAYYGNYTKGGKLNKF